MTRLVLQRGAGRDRISRASKTAYLKKKSRIGVATTAGCSTVTMEVTMLLFSTTPSLSDLAVSSTYLFVIPHNYVDRVRLAGGAA